MVKIYLLAFIYKTSKARFSLQIGANGFPRTYLSSTQLHYWTPHWQVLVVKDLVVVSACNMMWVDGFHGF
jgi:hypothetical protein